VELTLVASGATFLPWNTKPIVIGTRSSGIDEDEGEDDADLDAVT
jgi:hypothetical protein